MKKITTENLLSNIQYYTEQANLGKIFLYPTDTVYGIGAIPTAKSVEKIYEIKQRDLSKPLSIIAPNKNWIEENFIVPQNFKQILQDSLEKYHGVTFLLERKNPSFLKYVSNNNKIGIRLLKHSFQEFVSKLGEPFITTSANLSGENSADKINIINDKIINQIDYVIDGGKLYGKPSVIIDPFEGTEKWREK